MVELSEEHLYVYGQAALTLFGRLTQEVLERLLASVIPQVFCPSVAGRRLILGHCLKSSS
jgi:hypothetical protein